jgi:hypothetical protein
VRNFSFTWRKIKQGQERKDQVPEKSTEVGAGANAGTT